MFDIFSVVNKIRVYELYTSLHSVSVDFFSNVFGIGVVNFYSKYYIISVVLYYIVNIWLN